MSIKKTKNGTYQLRLYIPEDVQAKLGLGKLFERKYKTRREAKEVELKLSIDIKNAKSGKSHINIKMRLFDLQKYTGNICSYSQWTFVWILYYT